MKMDREYYNLRGKNLWKQLTNNGMKPIDKEVIATLSNEDIEALILATRPTEEEATVKSLSLLLEEDLLRNPNGDRINPPCFYYWDIDGVHLCERGGSYAVIEKEDCENCQNYRVMVAYN